MPWHKERNNPGCAAGEIAVVKDDDGAVEGCHATDAEADAQIAALYAAEAEAEAGATDPVLQAVFATLGEPTPDADYAAFSDGLWRGVLAVEGVETGDWPIREFKPGSLTWRDLPLPLHHLVAAHDGESNVVQIGAIREMWRAGDLIYAWGDLDMDLPHTLEVHRLMFKKMLRGVSVGLDQYGESDVEVIYPDNPGVEDEMFLEPEKFIFLRARIMEATVISTPALQEAFVELVPNGADPHEGLPAPSEAEMPMEMPGATGMASVAAEAPTAGEATEGTPPVTLETIAETLAANDQPRGVVAVAVPAEPELFTVAGGDPADELHVTLGYFDDANTIDPDVLDALKAWVTSTGAIDIAARVSGVARMGNDDPPATALLLEAAELNDLRASLEAVAEPDRTHPHFTPHLTLGYGVDMPELPPSELRLGAVEVWCAGERYGLDGPITAAGIAAPVKPPLAWFRNPRLTGPTPLTILDDGRVFGHVAAWGTCHTSFANTCVTPPRAPQGDYGYFRIGEIVCAEGDRVAVGHLTVGTGHAPSSLAARPAAEHYDNTGHVVADVAAGEDRYGIWVSGSLRPGLDDRIIRAVRSGGISGDWRKIGSHFRLVGALIVNVPGFPIPRVSTFVHDNEQFALVAAGMVLERQAAPRFSPVALRIARSIGRDPESRIAALRNRIHPEPLEV